MPKCYYLMNEITGKVISFETLNHYEIFLKEVGGDWKPCECKIRNSQIKDEQTKDLFIDYLKRNPNLRFFQAVRNFTTEYIDQRVNYIMAADHSHIIEDTFPWECYEKMKEIKQ